MAKQWKCVICKKELTSEEAFLDTKGESGTQGDIYCEEHNDLTPEKVIALKKVFKGRLHEKTS
jgi:hypothetical protein